MTTLVVLTAAPSLDLDGAAALVRALSDEDLTWIALAEPADVAHVDWLLEGLSARGWRWELGDEGRGDRAKSLVSSGLAYPCGCSEDRLRALARSCREEGRGAAYDGACRRSPVPGRTRRWRATAALAEAAGDPGLADHRLDVVLSMVVAIEARTFDRVVVEAGLWPDGRLALATLEAAEKRVPELLQAPWVVGPDGAPLWRPDGLSRVADLRADGIEPAGLRRFLTHPKSLRAIPFDAEALDAANLAAIRAIPTELAEARLSALLREAGIEVATPLLSRVWKAVSPRLTRFGRAAKLLAFLRAEVPVPGFDGHDAAQMSRVGPILLDRAPEHGADAQRVLEGEAHPPEEIHDFRRVVRWALTGQEVAPPLVTVWDLLGSRVALARIGAAVEALEVAKTHR